MNEYVIAGHLGKISRHLEKIVELLSRRTIPVAPKVNPERDQLLSQARSLVDASEREERYFESHEKVEFDRLMDRIIAIDKETE